MLTGVCTSVCQTNIDDLVTEKWVDRLIEMGVMYMWYHIYRPVGPDAKPELALTPEQQRRVRQFVVDTRATKPIGVVDAYYDGDGQALCPAATGFTHHISPWGDIEPCPIMQFANESIHDERPLREVFNESEFLRDFRHAGGQPPPAAASCWNGPTCSRSWSTSTAPATRTARQRPWPSWRRCTHRGSQFDPGHEIPERSLVYRFVKKHFFNDFGAYANPVDARGLGRA